MPTCDEINTEILICFPLFSSPSGLENNVTYHYQSCYQNVYSDDNSNKKIMVSIFDLIFDLAQSCRDLPHLLLEAV